MKRILGRERRLIFCFLFLASGVSGNLFGSEAFFRLDFEETLDGKRVGEGKEEVVPGQWENDVEFVEGIEGKGAVLSSRNQLVYPAESNIHLEVGSVTLWVKPLNWDWQAEEFVHFFEWNNRDEENRSVLLLYKYLRPGTDMGLFFLAGKLKQENEIPQWTVARNKVEESGKGEWTFLGITWDRASRVIEVYKEGKLLAYATVPAEQWPDQPAEMFSVFHTGNLPRNEDYQAVVDSFHIYDRALNSSEMEALYVKNAKNGKQEEEKLVEKSSIGSSRVVVPRLVRAPEIDGHYGSDEWTGAATISGFSLFNQLNSLADYQAVAHIGYDDENLYLGVLSVVPSGVSVVANTTERDSFEVGSDDAIEIFLSPSDGEIYQWIVNSVGTILDLKGEHFAKMSREWDGELKVQSQIYEQRWLCEMAIPWKSLGVESVGEREIWKANVSRDWAEAASSGEILYTAWSYASHALASDLGEIEFSSKLPIVDFVLDRDAMKRREMAGDIQIVSQDGGEYAGDIRIWFQNGDGEVTGEWDKTFLINKENEFSESFQLPVNGVNLVMRAEVVLKDGTKLLSHALPLQYPKGIMVSSVLAPEEEEIHFYVRYPGVFAVEEKVQIEAAVISDDKKTNHELSLKDLGQSVAMGIVKWETIPDGDYSLSGSVVAANGKEETFEYAFEKLVDPVWLTEKPGVMAGVPEPWTPVKVDGLNVHVHNRVIHFASNGLPHSILIGGEELLASPMQLVGESSGKALKFEQAKILFADDEKAMLEAVDEVSGWILRSEIEFDGMVKVSLYPHGDTGELKDLKLEIPVRSFEESFVHAHAFAWSMMERIRFKEDFHSRFYPYLWYGAETRGIAWFAESDKNWTRTDGRQPLHILKTEGKETIQIDIITESKTMNHEGIVFGYQPTPVKPMRENRRDIRAHRPNMNLLSPWAMRDKSIKRYQPVDAEWGWLGPHIGDYDKLREELEHWKSRDVVMPVYIAPTITSPESPAYQLFKDSWRNPHGSYPFACAGSTFTDELVWNVDQMIKNSGLQAIYIDCAWAYNCGNEKHGCGYRDENGDVRLTWPIFELREQFKRYYKLFHLGENVKNGYVWAHASGLAAAPIHAFVDLLTQGEEVRLEVISNPNYYDIYSLDTWRITYGSALGIEMQFLPEFAHESIREQQYHPDHNATFVSQALLHDTLVWDGFSDPAYLEKVYTVMDRYGYRDAATVFYPYWSQKSVYANAEEIEISFYESPTHRLAVVVNPTEKEIQTQIYFKEDQEPLTSTVFPESVSIDEQNGMLTIRKQNFILLVMEKNK